MRTAVLTGAAAALIGRIAAGEPSIDPLFNNAGVSTGELQWSRRGRELSYEVSAIAPYVLTRGLIGNLAPSGAGRAVNTSSNAVFSARRYDPAALAEPTTPFKKLFGPCASSKLALSLWTRAIAPERMERHVRVVSVDPGASKTPMTAGSGMSRALLLLFRPFFKPPSHGAGLLMAGATGAYTPGAFVTGGEERDPPFLDQADRTLRTADAAAFPPR